MIPSLSPVVALVNPQAASIYWYVVRASGFVLFVLLTLSVVLGLLMAMRWRSDAWPRVITEELHRYMLLVAGTFLVIHVVSTLLDSFVHLNVIQVLVPFNSSYRVIWMSAGIVGMYLATALYLSIYLRRFVGYKVWRTMHYAGSLAWLLALTHSVTTGSDTRAPWALGIYGGSALIVAFLLAVRFGGLPIPIGEKVPLRPRVLGTLGSALLLGTLLVESGPLAARWASRAGGSPTLALAPSASNVSLPPSTFSDAITGTSSQQNSGQLQQGTVLVNLHLHGQGVFPVSLSYGLLLAATQGGAQFIHGVFALSPSDHVWNCSGPASFQTPDVLTSTCSLPRGSTLQLTTRFRLDNSGHVTGQVTATAEGNVSPTGG